MAKKKSSSGRSKKARSSGGNLAGMRSGFKGMVGGDRKPKAKGETDFVKILMYMFLVAAAVILLSRVF